MKPLALLLLGILSLLAPAQAEDAPWTTFEELRDAEFQPGATLEIAGRYTELQDDEIRLFKCPARLRVKDRRLLRKVLDLASSHQNIRLKLRYLGGDEGFEVLEGSAGLPAGKHFEAEIEYLASRPGAVDHLISLGTRASETAKHFGEPALEEFSARAVQRAFQLLEEKLPPDDLARRLETVREVHARVKDRRLAMHMLVDLERRFPQSPEITEALLGLNCRRHGGKWKTYEEFKSEQGFEQHQGDWITPREREFLETINAFLAHRRDTILRRRLDREYDILATKGEVAIGMKPEEVYEALGYADRVYRKAVRDQDRNVRVVSQWVYGERYYYFLDGLILATPSDRTELDDPQRPGSPPKW